MKSLLSALLLLLVGLAAACTSTSPESGGVTTDPSPGRGGSRTAPTPTTPTPTTPTPTTPTPTASPTAAPANTPTVAPTATASDRASREQRVARGLEVCRREYCGTCHTLDAADTAGLFGPTHNGIGSTAERRIREPGYMGTATTVEAYIRESIVSPGVYVVEGYGLSRYRMPAYSHLDQEDLNALVQMLLQQKR